MLNSRNSDFEALRIKWMHKPIRGCTDIFEPGEFDEECKNVTSEHLVRCPGGWERYGKYRLTVLANRAILDYRAFKKTNQKRDIALGVMTIIFDNADRVAVRKVLWQEDCSDGPPTAAPVKWTTYEPGEVPQYEPPRSDEKASRRRRDIKERRGQRRFRAQLRRAYKDTCCVTGCAVAQALDAAHIDQHINERSDTPSNGLLLRGDLHRLFDADLLGIEPTERKVQLSECIAGFAGLEPIADGVVLRQPRKGFEAYGPSDLALKIRWRQFCDAERNR
jgi:hypothetical protein